MLLLCTTTNLTFKKLLQHRMTHAAHAGKIAPVPRRVAASVLGAGATARCVCVLSYSSNVFNVHPNSNVCSSLLVRSAHVKAARTRFP